MTTRTRTTGWRSQADCVVYGVRLKKLSTLNLIRLGRELVVHLLIKLLVPKHQLSQKAI